MTNAGNETNILTLVSTVNTQMNYFPGTLILIAIYIILLIALIGKGINPYKAFAATSWVGMILAIIAYPMSLISGFTLVIFSILAPLTLVLLFVLD